MARGQAPRNMAIFWPKVAKIWLTFQFGVRSSYASYSGYGARPNPTEYGQISTAFGQILANIPVCGTFLLFRACRAVNPHGIWPRLDRFWPNSGQYASLGDRAHYSGYDGWSSSTEYGQIFATFGQILANTPARRAIPSIPGFSVGRPRAPLGI